MSITADESATERRARARAQAAAIVDSPRVQRRLLVPARGALRRSPRSRRSVTRTFRTAAPSPRGRWPRRWIAAAALLVEVAALLLALTLPAFKVRTVTVSGERLMSRQLLLRTAGLEAGSIFTVDGDAVRARLLSLPWIADATVSTDLPSSVHIVVDERMPVLRVRRGATDMLLAGNGASLTWPHTPAAQVQGLPVLVDERAGSATPLDPALVEVLGAVAARFQGLVGVPLAGFEWGADDVLAAWASTGWRAIFGHLDTDAAVAGIPAQVAALAALRGQLDVAKPSFGYVDLENPQAPAVGGSPGLPESIRSAALPPAGVAPLLPGSVAPPVSTPVPTSSPSPGSTPGSAPSLSPSPGAVSPSPGAT